MGSPSLVHIGDETLSRTNECIVTGSTLYPDLNPHTTLNPQARNHRTPPVVDLTIDVMATGLLSFSDWGNAIEQICSSLDPRESALLFWNDKTRPDEGRLYVQARTTHVQTGVLTKNAIGSALVRLGKDTQVIVAVTYMVGQPTGNPDAGDVAVSISNGDAALQSWLVRIMESTLDMTQLSIIPGKASFRLCLTVQVIHDGGNLRDASLLASVAALGDTKLPENTVWDAGRIWIDHTRTKTTKKFTMKVLPVSLTIALWARPSTSNTEEELLLIVDPRSDEEHASESTVTFVVDAYEPKTIISMEFAGLTPITSTELALAGHMACVRATELRSILQAH